jgi:mxaA protein
MSGRIARALLSAIIALGFVADAATLHADSQADLDVVPPPNAAVEQPRPFGYVIGDLLTQRVLLELNGHAFEPGSLPRGERISAWLERRPASIETAPDGRRWLSVEYQVINAPKALSLVHIPAWGVKAKSSTEVLRIGEWPISLSPLTPRAAFAQGDLPELRPDRPPPSIATEPMRRSIVMWSIALILTLAIWSGWWLWRNWRASATQPFATALREIRRTGDDEPEAWQALHRAFDRTAGRVTQIATLPNLFRSAPYLAPLRSKIEQFFRQSSERFFGAGLPQDALSVRALCAELRRLEKTRER